MKQLKQPEPTTLQQIDIEADAIACRAIDAKTPNKAYELRIHSNRLDTFLYISGGAKKLQIEVE